MGGLKLANVMLMIFVIFSLLYYSLYDYIQSKDPVFKRSRFIVMSVSLGLFFYYYNANYHFIISSISYSPGWLPKTTFVFLLYLAIYCLVHIFAFLLLTRSINKFKIGPKSIELELEKRLADDVFHITKKTNSLIENQLDIYQNDTTISEAYFRNFNLLEEVDANLIYNFYIQLISACFHDSNIHINIRIIDFDDETSLRNIIDTLSCSYLLKLNGYDDVVSKNITRLENYIFVPFKDRITDSNAIGIIEFDNKDECLTSYGNIISSIIVHMGNCVKAYFLEEHIEQNN